MLDIQDFQAKLVSGSDNDLFTMLRKLMSFGSQGLAVSPLNGWPQWHGNRESEGPADDPALSCRPTDAPQGWPQWHSRRAADDAPQGWPQWHSRRAVDDAPQGWPQWHSRRPVDAPHIGGPALPCSVPSV